jgi:deazaflavin-dependent oxidoreductase (nitroreductase family)
MTALAEQEDVRILPRFLVRIFWVLHRTAYRLTGGRFGLSQPQAGTRFGMMRLATVGRRSGKPRVAIVGYIEDGPNLVTIAMNGWGESEPAWWLNLQSNPDAVVGLTTGPRAVRARAATGSERERLWAKVGDYPGWGNDIDALAARRPAETAVVVLEPRDDGADRLREVATVFDQQHDQPIEAAPTASRISRTQDTQRRRLRLRHLWLVPGLAIAAFANTRATDLGLGIVPLLVFGIAPDLPRLLGLGQPHAPGQMAARAVPAFNLMHHPLPPLAVLALAVTGVLPPVFFVGAIAWLGHLVMGIGIGDRLRRRDGFLRPLPTLGRPAPRRPAAGGTATPMSAERAE